MKRYIAAAFLFATLVCAAQTDTTQFELRLNPQIEEQVYTNQFPCLNAEASQVILNGADWTSLQQKFKDDSVFTVVYLGDSHIQADFGGSEVRRILANVRGSAGRGIIIPFRLAGTNQPVDYQILSETEFAGSRLLKKPWVTDMTFTGIGIHSDSANVTFDLVVNEPFVEVQLFGVGELPQLTKMSRLSTLEQIPVEIDSLGVINMQDTAKAVRIELAQANKFTFGGFALRANTSCTIVHSIGNNGATFGSYLEVPNFAKELASLQGDLIVIALGTNEGFGSQTIEEIVGDARQLISEVRKENPEAEIMLVMPTECFKKKYRRRRGRRRAATQVLNTKVNKIYSALMTMAEEDSIPVYDAHEVVGSASKAKNQSLLGKDGVHFTAQGYRATGTLLGNAIVEILIPVVDSNSDNAGSNKD